MWQFKVRFVRLLALGLGLLSVAWLLHARLGSSSWMILGMKYEEAVSTVKGSSPSENHVMSYNYETNEEVLLGDLIGHHIGDLKSSDQSVAASGPSKPEDFKRLSSFTQVDGSKIAVYSSSDVLFVGVSATSHAAGETHGLSAAASIAALTSMTPTVTATNLKMASSDTTFTPATSMLASTFSIEQNSLYTNENFRPGKKVDGQDITDVEILGHIESILELESTIMPRMQCPGELSIGRRYEILRPNDNSQKIRYLFTADLHNTKNVINRLIASFIQVARYLGPEACAISIVEGRSKDGTYNILDALTPHLASLGLKYWLHQSDIDPGAEGKNRIAQLAKLRNLALEPLTTDTNGAFAPNVQVVFFNDILPCPDDVLELLYQQHLQNATQSCAMDWIAHGRDFYDVWVSRTMTGNILFEIPQNGDWSFVNNLFWDDPRTRKKFERRVPFQVYSCWGGLTVVEGALFRDQGLRLRRNVKGECYGGEPQMLASDLIKLGRGHVQIIPTVNVGYISNEDGLDVKNFQGYVHQRVDVQKFIDDFEHDDVTERIRWEHPPAKIRCMPLNGQMSWVDPVYDPSGVEDGDVDPGYDCYGKDCRGLATWEEDT